MAEAGDPRALRYGIEAEFALVDDAGRFCDFRSLTWPRAQHIVRHLDRAGHPELTRGDLGIKSGRWYVEGDERFDADGRFVDCVPKGIETRTPPATGIVPTVELLERQTAALVDAASREGYRLASIGWNPFADAYRPQPAYNRWELTMRAARPEYAAPDVYMLSYGPDLNLSVPGWSDADAIDAAALLTALSPVLVPFSFSAPFGEGRRAPELSRRTARRTGRRPAVRVFVDPANVPERQPTPPMIHPARIPSERGRLEFKAFDAIIEASLYPALLALLAGLVVARPPWARADVPDTEAHATAAREGFALATVRDGAHAALRCASRSLRDPDLSDLLDPLWRTLRVGLTPAHSMLHDFASDGIVPLPAVGGA